MCMESLLLEALKVLHEGSLDRCRIVVEVILCLFVNVSSTVVCVCSMCFVFVVNVKSVLVPGVVPGYHTPVSGLL